jgi:quercetin dioxygenase-like cupin family protein/DNA-binding XRE family transcriptional regulator
VRGLAAKVEISPSALSQIETGRSRPSVRTLYALVSELGLSLDELFAAEPVAAGTVPARVARNQAVLPAAGEIVLRADERKQIRLESGVTWERLNPVGERDIEFLEVTYDVGGASSGTGTFARHQGREYGLVLTGRLKVTVGFEEYELAPGDSISFESNIPHRLETLGKSPVKAVWFVIGRSDSDGRVRWPADGS